MSRHNTPPKDANVDTALDHVLDPANLSAEDDQHLDEESGLDAVQPPSPPWRRRTSVHSLPSDPRRPDALGDGGLYNPGAWDRTAAQVARGRRLNTRYSSRQPRCSPGSRTRLEYDPASALYQPQQLNGSRKRSSSAAASSQASPRSMRLAVVADQVGWCFHGRLGDLARRFEDFEARVEGRLDRLENQRARKSNASLSSSSSSSGGDSSSNVSKRKRSGNKKVSFDEDANDRDDDDGDDDDDNNGPSPPSKRQKKGTPSASSSPSSKSKGSASPHTPAQKAASKSPKPPRKAALKPKQNDKREEPTSPTPRRVTRHKAPRTPPRQASRAAAQTPRAPKKGAPKKPTTRAAPIPAPAVISATISNARTARDVTATAGEPRRSIRIRAKAAQADAASKPSKAVARKSAGGKKK